MAFNEIDKGSNSGRMVSVSTQINFHEEIVEYPSTPALKVASEQQLYCQEVRVRLLPAYFRWSNSKTVILTS